jgi:hypothetical protein
VPKDKVTALVGIKSSDVMKFMVSGGVSPLGTLENKNGH